MLGIQQAGNHHTDPMTPDADTAPPTALDDGSPRSPARRPNDAPTASTTPTGAGHETTGAGHETAATTQSPAPRQAPAGPSTLVDLLAVGAILALVGSLFIDRILDLDGTTTCWWRHLVHRDCLGCGLTHAFVAMRTADVSTATAWHPLGVLVWASAVVLATWYGLEKALARRLRPRWWMRALALWGRVLGLALLAVGVARLFGPPSPP